MPIPCYLSSEGKTQGYITAGAFTSDSIGNIYVEGHGDEMLVQAFRHVVTVPTDHRPASACTSRKAVPLMYNALASVEMLPTITLPEPLVFSNFFYPAHIPSVLVRDLLPIRWKNNSSRDYLQGGMIFGGYIVCQCSALLSGLIPPAQLFQRQRLSAGA